MRKNKLLFKLKKWFLIGVLFLCIIWVPRYKEEKEEGFWKIGREVVQEYFVKQILYSQSVIWGFVEDMEQGIWQKTPTLATESYLGIELYQSIYIADQELEEKVLEENSRKSYGSKEEFVLTENSVFCPATKKTVEFDLKKYGTAEELIKQFYNVDPTAKVKPELFNVDTLSNMDCSVDKEAEGPQILIYHTHSQEAFANSEVGKEEDTILGAGEILATYLEEYGFEVYHHKGKYDVEKRDYAYSESLPAIQKILQDNPTIQVVLDLHRDAVAEETRLVTDLQGKQVAKVMFFNGLSCSAQQGDISYLENPYLQENLAFSFQMKLACDEYYPGFARSIYLRAYRYNMHLCPKTLLIELGAQTNTVEEIQEALGPLAHVLSIVLD